MDPTRAAGRSRPNPSCVNDHCWGRRACARPHRGAARGAPAFPGRRGPAAARTGDSGHGPPSRYPVTAPCHGILPRYPVTTEALSPPPCRRCPAVLLQPRLGPRHAGGRSTGPPPHRPRRPRLPRGNSRRPAASAGRSDAGSLRRQP